MIDITYARAFGNLEVVLSLSMPLREGRPREDGKVLGRILKADLEGVIVRSLQGERRVPYQNIRSINFLRPLAASLSERNLPDAQPGESVSVELRDGSRLQGIYSRPRPQHGVFITLPDASSKAIPFEQIRKLEVVT
jgi:hypothetical protein